ncbi:GNAT family N-acetyltransferase [Arthrobacter sp. NPDC093128]|uniref:GNAT family N-acetyltransferase n=1 Tax=Arthrobacter sp. NPDC093128 TaxID=3154979 RepID=UPI00344ACE1A
MVPRSTLPGVAENRALARILDDDPDAWWVSCFVVRREYRGKGIGTVLLDAAVDWAAQHGASILEGHPIDTSGLAGAPSPSALFTGTLAMTQMDSPMRWGGRVQAFRTTDAVAASVLWRSHSTSTPTRSSRIPSTARSWQTTALCWQEKLGRRPLQRHIPA